MQLISIFSNSTTYLLNQVRVINSLNYLLFNHYSLVDHFSAEYRRLVAHFEM